MAQEMFSVAHQVTLRDITEHNLIEIMKLDVLTSQKKCVAPNSVSIAQAHYSKTAWFKGIYLKEQPVGFVMLDLDESKPEYFLWRLMIDGRYQGKGYGREALEMVIDYVQTLPNAHELITSCLPGVDGPEAFYKKLGFEPTGNMIDDEIALSYHFEHEAHVEHGEHEANGESE